jgi:hypothetical protein
LSSFDKEVVCKIGGEPAICTVSNGKLSLPVGVNGFKADGTALEIEI